MAADFSGGYPAEGIYRAWKRQVDVSLALDLVQAT